LERNYPNLIYNEVNRIISGVLEFYRSFKGKTIRGKYSIEFKLEHGSESILPKVRETKSKILSIAKRKKLPNLADIHLSNNNGELCLILPIKENEHFPNGFEIRRFMNLLETHLYWITYYDRYNEKPWEDEPHNPEEALIKAAKENKNYRKELRDYKEKKEDRKLTRPEFRRYLREKNIL